MDSTTFEPHRTWQAPFLVRLQEGILALDLSPAQEKVFTEKAGTIVRSTERLLMRTGRTLLKALFEFDEYAKTLQHESTDVRHMVGILTLTNQEFTNLVYQSARHMAASSQALIEFDVQNGTLMIPSRFGTMQKFEIDTQALHKQDQLRLGAQGKISVKHSDILKAALLAYMRSLMLASCYDAQPMNRCFNSISSDTMYMA